MPSHWRSVPRQRSSSLSRSGAYLSDRYDNDVEVEVCFTSGEDTEPRKARLKLTEIFGLSEYGACLLEIGAPNPRPLVFAAMATILDQASDAIWTVVTFDLRGWARLSVAEWRDANGRPFGSWFRSYGSHLGVPAANGRRDAAVRKILRRGGELGGGRKTVDAVIGVALLEEYELKFPPIWEIVRHDDAERVEVVAEGGGQWRKPTVDRAIDELSKFAGEGRRRRVPTMTPSILGETITRSVEPRDYGPINDRLARLLDQHWPELLEPERIETAQRMFATELGRFWWLNWGLPRVDTPPEAGEFDIASPDPHWASVDPTGNAAVANVTRTTERNSATLTERQAAMLKMREEGYGYDEIAVAFDCAVNTAKATVGQARKKIRQISSPD